MTIQSRACYFSSHDYRSQIIDECQDECLSAQHFLKVQPADLVYKLWPDAARKGNISLSTSRCSVHTPSLSAFEDFFQRPPFPYTQAKVLQLSDSSCYSNFSIFSFTVTTHSVWQASSILMTPDNKSSHTCALHSIIHSLLCYSNMWIRMIGFIILFSVCFSKEPLAKVMVHLNSEPNDNGKVKTCGELLTLILDQGCQFGWSVFSSEHTSQENFHWIRQKWTASSKDKEVTLVCFIWCTKRFDVILDDLYCCFNKSQLLFFQYLHFFAADKTVGVLLMQ